MSSAWKSFHLAMYALSSGDTQRERLLRAYKLHLMRLSKKDVPAEIRDQFASLQDDISRCAAREGECGVKNTLNAMSDDEIKRMINSIIHMYDAVTRYQPILSLKQSS
jgi:cation transport regulator ChaB